VLKRKYGFFLSTVQVEDRCMDERDAEAIDISDSPMEKHHDIS
jgi:hypothetical protein